MSEDRQGIGSSPAVVHTIGAAVCAAALVAWYVGLVAPLLGSSAMVRRDQARVAELEAQIAELEKTNDARAATIRAQDLERAASDRRLRPLSTLNQRIAEVADVAEAHGLAISGLGPGAPVDSPLAAKVPIAIDGTCQSANVVRFLAAMHQQFPDIAIASFIVSGPAGDGADASVHLDLVWFAERAAGATSAQAHEP